MKLIWILNMKKGKIWLLGILSSFSLAASTFTVDINFVNNTQQEIKIIDMGHILSMLEDRVNIPPSKTYIFHNDYKSYFFNSSLPTLPRKYIIISAEEKHYLGSHLTTNSDGTLRSYDYTSRPLRPSKEPSRGLHFTHSTDEYPDHVEHTVTISEAVTN